MNTTEKMKIVTWSFDQDVLARFHYKVDALIEKIKQDKMKQNNKKHKVII